MQNNRAAFVKRRIVKIGLLFRVLLLAIPLTSRILGGLRVDEFEILMLLIAPASCLYFTLLIKFVIRNRYLLKGETFDSFYIVLGRAFLVIPALFELVLILYKSLYGSPGDEIFYTFIALIESSLAMYAGFYLSEIFRSSNQEQIPPPR